MARTMKHYGFTMHRYHSKLVCLHKRVEWTDINIKALAYYAMFPFSVHYESVMRYVTGPNTLAYF